jgi:hypothetical protein
VFAPTNAAFAKLPAGTVDNLLKPANKGKLVGPAGIGEHDLLDVRHEGGPSEMSRGL